MRKLLRRCSSCSRYTLQMKCPKCGGETVSPHPAKFSPQDRYIKYRVRDRYIERKDADQHSESG